MNGRERVEAVIKGIVPDRVPVMCQLSAGHVIKNSGLPPAEYYLNYNDVVTDAISNLVFKYGFDGAIMEAPGFDMELAKSQVDKIIDESNGQLIVWKNGDKTFCPINDYPIFRPKVKPVKKTIHEIKASDMMHNAGYTKKLNELPEYFMAPYRRILEKIGETHSIHGYFVTPLSLFIHTLGIEEALMSMLEYPEICIALLNEVADGCIQWSDNLIDSGIPIIGISAPYEGRGFMSLGMYEEFGFPTVKKIINHIKARGIPTYTHMCGSINDRLEKIVEAETDGIECLDPYPLGNVELEDTIKRIGDKVFIKGNMDSVNTLLMKTPAEVYDDAVARIKIAGPTKRYILSSACSVSPDTPEENLKILVKAAEDYGRY